MSHLLLDAQVPNGNCWCAEGRPDAAEQLLAADRCCQLQVDQPGRGGPYLCPHPGGYTLQHGQLRPFRQATAGPIMLVSLTLYFECLALLWRCALAVCHAYNPQDSPSG